MRAIVFTEEIVTRFFAPALMLLTLLLGMQPAFAANEKAWPIDQVVGNSNAPITIVEYSSLTCSHCARFHIEVYPKLKAEWLDTGKAKLIYRDFPWDPMAQAAAMVAHCSGPRYFSFVNAFFHAQDQWAHSQTPLQAIKTIAKLGGMGEEQVDKCLEDRGLLNEINVRKEEEQKKWNIDSTPSFVIGGTLYSGAKPYDEFVKILMDQKK